MSASNFPDVDPPEYRISRPTESTLYTFTPISFNAMILHPPPDASDDLPHFHISVNANCFYPLAHITTIYRGQTPFGDKMGYFEMGISGISSRVRVHGRETRINTMLEKHGSRKKGYWTWKPHTLPSSHLTWDYRTLPIICRSKGVGKPVLAIYTPARSLDDSKNGGPAISDEDSLSTLEVTMAGRKLFDDILISLLIVERKRMLPGRDNVLKQLFS